MFIVASNISTQKRRAEFVRTSKFSVSNFWISFLFKISRCVVFLNILRRKCCKWSSYSTTTQLAIARSSGFLLSTESFALNYYFFLISYFFRSIRKWKGIPYSVNINLYYFLRMSGISKFWFLNTVFGWTIHFMLHSKYILCN